MQLDRTLIPPPTQYCPIFGLSACPTASAPTPTTVVAYGIPASVGASGVGAEAKAPAVAPSHPAVVDVAEVDVLVAGQPRILDRLRNLRQFGGKLYRYAGIRCTTGRTQTARRQATRQRTARDMHRR